MSGVQRLMLRMQGGFCNRLRAIVSGVLWAEDLNCKLNIFWPVETEHMASTLEELIDPTSIPSLTIVRAGYLGNARQINSSSDMEAILNMFKGADEVRIESYSEFHPEVRNQRGLSILRGIRFNPEIERDADLQWRLLDGKSDWVGIHFRGTDHWKCLKNSPISSFFKHLGSEGLRSEGLRSEGLGSEGLRSEGLRSGSKFYLATDEPSVKEEFTYRYGKELVVNAGLELGRRTSKQQKAGIIEWLLLQKCMRIMGSAGSSYSELAALRSGCPYTPISESTPTESVETKG